MWVSKIDPDKLDPIESCECGCNPEEESND